ncbi:MAG: triose-phosphate isomerase [Planktomarina sp.]
MAVRQAVAAGNWKMNGTSSDLEEVRAVSAEASKLDGIQSLLCLPATLIDRARSLGLAVGGEDCHTATNGAHTGDTSADMLKDAGADYVIVGHSERRADHGEDDATVAAKTKAAWDAGLVAIICIGETEAQYRAGETLDVLDVQIKGSVPAGATPANTIIAYEPVWAIGSGLTPTMQEIQDTHAAVRAKLAAAVDGGADLSVLYGGSVKPGNAAEIFALEDVDGGLVGGASLKSTDFIPIMQALHGAKTGN